MKTAYGVARKLLREFGNVSDCELSLADMRWLEQRIITAITNAVESNSKIVADNGMVFNFNILDRAKEDIQRYPDPQVNYVDKMYEQVKKAESLTEAYKIVSEYLGCP
jgi:hypothetical protein